MSLLPIAIRLYRLLLFLYPGEFHRAYAEEMSLLFREMCLQEWHRRGWIGLVSFWLEAVFDVLRCVFLLHSERVAVSALAGASATLVYGVTLLLIEPRLGFVPVHSQPGPLAFGVQGVLVTFAFGWMCVFCGFLFFPRSSRAASVVLDLGGPVDAIAGSSKPRFPGRITPSSN